MEKFVHILVHSIEDTAVLIPFLLIVYFLIEFLEYKNVFRFEKSKFLTGKASPIFGSCFGIIPQCGFSVISAELYSERKMSLAALIAVFLATSDEAFPILISNYKSLPTLLLLIVVKFLIAIIVGYFVMFISSKLFKNNVQKINNEKVNVKSLSDDKIEIKSDSKTNNIHSEHKHNEKHSHDNHKHHDSHSHSEHDENHSKNEHHNHDEHDEHGKEHSSHIHACCHHDIEGQEKFNWKHPIIHSLKITVYIFIVNFILTSFIEIIGEDKIADFLQSNSFLQPLLALIVGFIPNCASSVIITELFMQKLITFGSLITGLCANAGLGLFVLFKTNKNLKENLFIVATIIISSLLFGYALHFIPLDFLHIL